MGQELSIVTDVGNNLTVATNCIKLTTRSNHEYKYYEVNIDTMKNKKVGYDHTRVKKNFG